MADSVLYADLNLPELSRSRILTVPDVQDSSCTYAEVKVKSQDTNAAANCKSSGKSCCSRKCVALCVVTILVLVLAVCLIITYGPTAGSQESSTAVNSSSQNDSNPLSPPNQEDSRTLSPTKQKDSTTLSPTSQQGSTKVTSTSQNVSTPLTPTRQNVSTPLSPTSQEDSTKLPPSHGETPGKSCCSTTRVAVLVTEIILLLLTALFQIIPCNRPCSRAHMAVLVVVLLLAVLALTLSWTLPGAPIENSQQESTPLSPTSKQDSKKLPPIHGEEAGCPPAWKKHERKCYFFSPERNWNDWESSRAECAAMGSDLVIIESEEELKYLLSQSLHGYYFLGLRYSPEEQKWKWINNVEYDPARFPIIRLYRDYQCTDIGLGEIGAAPCSGTETTKNMCEKPAIM